MRRRFCCATTPSWLEPHGKRKRTQGGCGWCLVCRSAPVRSSLDLAPWHETQQCRKRGPAECVQGQFCAQTAEAVIIPSTSHTDQAEFQRASRVTRVDGSSPPRGFRTIKPMQTQHKLRIHPMLTVAKIDLHLNDDLRGQAERLWVRKRGTTSN